MKPPFQFRNIRGEISYVPQLDGFSTKYIVRSIAHFHYNYSSHAGKLLPINHIVAPVVVYKGMAEAVNDILEEVNIGKDLRNYMSQRKKITENVLVAASCSGVGIAISFANSALAFGVSVAFAFGAGYITKKKLEKKRNQVPGVVQDLLIEPAYTELRSSLERSIILVESIDSDPSLEVFLNK